MDSIRRRSLATGLKLTSERPKRDGAETCLRKANAVRRGIVSRPGT
jgi:hypothetical protein